jgi:transposase InsO family protein
MGQILHRSARTTEAVRRAIQHGQASLRDLARRFGINPKTIAKLRKRASVADQPTGPRRRAQPPSRQTRKPSSWRSVAIPSCRCRIHTVLTDNAIPFRFAPRYADGPTAQYMTHMFAMRCVEHGIEHRFTRISHPWTNGQVERMNRAIKDATVKRFHYDSHEQLRRHLQDFGAASNFTRRLTRLRGLKPYEFICKTWAAEPERFKANPHHQMLGLST